MKFVDWLFVAGVFIIVVSWIFDAAYGSRIDNLSRKMAEQQLQIQALRVQVKFLMREKE